MGSHEKFSRPGTGDFGRLEWAVLGTTCDAVRAWAKAIATRLAPYAIAYVDAAHAGGEGEEGHFFAQVEFQSERYQLLRRKPWNKWHWRPELAQANAVILNGNHHKGLQQIVVLDTRKRESLAGKLDRLTDVVLVLSRDGEPLYDFLEDKVPDVPVLDWDDYEAVAAFLRERIVAAAPPLYGLVLAGGRSRRMGEDKTLIRYHGKPQREYVADLLAGFCERVFISGRPDQAGEPVGTYEWLPDTFLELGPFGGLLSAFRRHPDRAWLVMAVDLPAMPAEGLMRLVAARQSGKIATAFRNDTSGFPEPLVTIWEPSAYPVLLKFLSQGITCPRKVLINSDVEVLPLPEQEWIANANTPEERDRFL